MENIIYIILLILTIVLIKMIFKISIRKAKELENNEKAQKITDKFPENIEIAKEMLEMLNNKNVKIEEAKNTKTSLYIAVTNKISIADMKNNYARIQTIAHECLHSFQDRKLLLFNFIFSNISIIYFIVISILTILNIINSQMLQIAVLMLFVLIKFSVRGFLEIDAMTKSRYLAEKYIDKKNICTIEEKEVLIKEYEEINKAGIPFTIGYLLISEITKVLIYTIICVII